MIFLDIDDVLNDDGIEREKGTKIDELFVRNLRNIVDVTGAEIILTSSWRNGVAVDAIYGNRKDEGLAQLYAWFDRYHLNIAGATPLIYNGANGRPLEIRTWLTRRTGISRFVEVSIRHL